MLALDRLSPQERAAFLLHDVFDVPFSEVATMLERRGRPAASWRHGRAAPCATNGRCHRRRRITTRIC